MILPKFLTRPLLAGGTVVVLLTSLWGCGEKLSVETGEAQRRDLLSSVSVTGIIQPETVVPVAPDVSGEVVQINIEEGDLVEQGQLLFEIRPDNFQAAAEQAQASVNSARADYANAQAALQQAKSTLLQDSLEYERQKQLYEQKATTEQQFQQARLRYQLSQSAVQSAEKATEAAYYRIQSAQANLRRAQDELSRTRVFASMDGTVTMADVQIGQRVVGTGMMSGTEVMRIANLQRMMVEVEVNENDIVHLSLGDTATIEVDAFGDRKFKGKVAEIGYSPVGNELANQVDQVTNYPVKVLIERSSYVNDKEIMKGLEAHQSPFRPGMSAVVNIYTDRAAGVISVPIQAVTLSKEEAAEGTEPPRVVYVLENGSVREQEVETGISDNQYIEIKSGLAQGTEIVTGPFTTITKLLRDGMEVEPKRAGQGQSNAEAAPEATAE